MWHLIYYWHILQIYAVFRIVFQFIGIKGNGIKDIELDPLKVFTINVFGETILVKERKIVKTVQFSKFEMNNADKAFVDLILWFAYFNKGTSHYAFDMVKLKKKLKRKCAILHFANHISYGKGEWDLNLPSINL